MKKIYLFVLGILLLTGCSQTKEEAEVTDYDPKTTIIGIEPGSGTFASLSERAVEAYNLDQELHSGSSAVMTQLLQDAYKKKSPSSSQAGPHWKFVDMDLKIFDDPKISSAKNPFTPIRARGLRKITPRPMPF